MRQSSATRTRSLAKLHAYEGVGITAFILSGYPHEAEAELFARHVLPALPHRRLYDGTR